MVHISELSSQRISDPTEVCKVGETVTAEVISIDQDARKIGLSVRLAKLRAENGDVSSYKPTTPNSSFGDVFGDQLKGISTDGDGN